MISTDHKLNKYNYKINNTIDKISNNSNIQNSDKLQLDNYFEHYKFHIYQKGGGDFESLINLISDLQHKINEYVKECEIEYDKIQENNKYTNHNIEKLISTKVECKRELSDLKLENQVGGTNDFDKIKQLIQDISDKINNYISQCKIIKNNNQQSEQKKTLMKDIVECKLELGKLKK